MFMLIEGLRVLYPKLHAAIRDNADLFLKGEPREAVRGFADGFKIVVCPQLPTQLPQLIFSQQVSRLF